MSELHDLFEDPWDRVARLIPRALDPGASPEDRRAACESLAQLDSGVLHQLALDGEWRDILRQLEPGEETGSGTGGSPEFRCQSGRERAGQYASELRVLVGDDFANPVRIVREPPPPETSALAQLPFAIATDPFDPLGDPSGQARRAAWSTLLVGPSLLDVANAFPGDGSAVAAYVVETLEHSVPMAPPWRLASFVTAVLRSHPTLRPWLDEILARLHSIVSRVAVDPDSAEALCYRFDTLRLEIARAVRDGEVVGREPLAVLDLWSAVALIRAAGIRDVARAWAASGGDPARVGVEFTRLDATGDLQAERALRAILSESRAHNLPTTSRADREALHFASRIRDRPVGPEREILLRDPVPWEVEDGLD